MQYIDIRKTWIGARKEKRTVDIKVLAGIIDKVQKLAKDSNVSDEISFDQFVNKAIKSEYKAYQDAHSQGVDVSQELEFISNYLPKVLSKEDIMVEVKKIISSILEPKIGDIMKACKGREDLDMKIVQEVAKELL